MSIRLLGYGWPYRYLIVFMLGCTLLYSGFDRARLFLAKFLFDDVFPSVAPAREAAGKVFEPKTPIVRDLFEVLGFEPTVIRMLIFLCLLAAVFAIGMAVFGYFRLYVTEYVSNRIVVDLQEQIHGHLLRLHLGFFDVERVGEMMARTTYDVWITHRALHFLFGDILKQIFMIAASVVVAFIASWQLAIIVLLVTPFLFWIIARFGRKIRRSSKRRLESVAALTDDLQQKLAGIRIVKAFGAEEEEEEAFRQRLDTFFKHAMRVSRAKILSKSTLELLTNLLILALMLVGTWLLMGGVFALTLGNFALFLGAVVTMYMPMKILVKAYNTFQESLAGGERIFEILDRGPEVQDSEDAVDLDRLQVGVAFKEVSFSYHGAENGREILKGIDIEIKKGEVVALVGETGAGKSTLVDLLFRFYDPDKGSVQIDGVDLRKVRRASLLQHLAVVSQDPFLFNASIKENISYGKKEATQAEIESAAKAAWIHDLIVTLPEGYDTVVGERGASLSGGERQRVTIARALLKDADILILDEATSSLDSRSEKEVQTALDNLMEGRTTLIIAHRLSTIVGADRIVVLQDGRVAESGTHAELLERRGVYHHLFEIQRQGLAENGGK